MIYFELNLDGSVKVYEMTDRLVLLRAQIETRARALPIAETVDDAIEYLRAGCFQFECFETLIEAETWQSSYAGFRAFEVRAEFHRFKARSAPNHSETQAA
jgi:hypothetical protein